jgi:hypothetical protein
MILVDAFDVGFSVIGGAALAAAVTYFVVSLVYG